MQAVNNSQQNISSIAKELSAAQKKADKANVKGGRKADEASTSVDQAAQQWESQAPYVFEQLQALDERRVNNLRDVLTQFQTHEVDQVERNRASAESCLNALLNLETADEIRTFAAKVAGGRAGLGRRRSSAAASTRPATSSLQVPPAPPPPRLTQDRSVHRQSSQDVTPQLPETPQKSKLGGLKRLGTVMNRRKSMAPPPPPSEKKKEKRSLMPFRRGDSSRSFQDLEETGADLSRGPTNEQASLSQIQSAETASREQLPPQPIVEETQPMVNGTSNNPFMQSQQMQQPIDQSQPQQGPLSMTMQPLTPQQPASATSPQFSPPQGPPPIQSDPIARAQQEAAATTPTEMDESARNFAIRDKPIQEDESEAQLAMTNMANQLRMQAQSSGVNRTMGSVRGRRDVRNTMFIPSGVDTSAIAAATTPPATQASPAPSDLASPISRPPPRTILEDQPLSDTHSVHSSHSLTNIAHHPDLHSPGLNASIIETINTWFSESGVSKSFITGEIALSYNPSTSTSPPAGETIRLTHFELLEKVAANPTFVTSPKSIENEDQAGTYSIALSSIRKPTPTVGLKYQLHLDETNLAAYSPLLLTPAWQILEGQTSVILLYSLNPTFAVQGLDSLTLRNVTITIALDPNTPGDARAQSAMMAPTSHASFRRKIGAGAVSWKFPELVLSGTQERMLVRFMTGTGTAKRGSIDVRFEGGSRSASDVGVERRVEGVAGAGGSDPFADADADEKVGDGWEGVDVKRGMVSGKYTAI